jgi:hypothetical protein
MTDVSKSVQLAHRMWPHLVILAGRRTTTTYQALGEQHGITGQALQNFARILAPIKYYCVQHGLPPLSALVVRKDSGLPGTGAEADDTDILAVYAYDWQARRPLIPGEAELAAAIATASDTMQGRHGNLP